MAASPILVYCRIIYSHTVTSARQRSGRQEARRRVSPASHLQLSELSCVRALCAALHRGAYNHLQRLYVAGGQKTSHYSIAHGVDGICLFLRSACTSERYRAAVDSAVCAALPYLTPYDGDSHSYYVRRRHQGRACVEWHEPCAVIHGRLLEPDLRLAQGMFSYRI
jgi:hypothetical protein